MAKASTPVAAPVAAPEFVELPTLERDALSPGVSYIEVKEDFASGGYNFRAGNILAADDFLTIHADHFANPGALLATRVGGGFLAFVTGGVLTGDPAAPITGTDAFPETGAEDGA